MQTVTTCVGTQRGSSCSTCRCSTCIRVLVVSCSESADVPSTAGTVAVRVPDDTRTCVPAAAKPGAPNKTNNNTHTMAS